MRLLGPIGIGAPNFYSFKHRIYFPSFATLKSCARTKRNPPANANPFIIAIVGIGNSIRSAYISFRPLMRSLVKSDDYKLCKSIPFEYTFSLELTVTRQVPFKSDRSQMDFNESQTPLMNSFEIMLFFVLRTRKKMFPTFSTKMISFLFLQLWISIYLMFIKTPNPSLLAWPIQTCFSGFD
jgi:hypothetical protein